MNPDDMEQRLTELEAQIDWIGKRFVWLWWGFWVVAGVIVGYACGVLALAVYP